MPEPINGNFNNMKNIILSTQVGAGYDILLSKKVKDYDNNITKVRYTVLSPFINFQPYFGQNPRTIETWNLTTLRIGFTLKFGSTKIQKKETTYVEPVKPIIIDSVVESIKPIVVEVVEPIIIVKPITSSYNLFFDFDKYNLIDKNKSELDNLVIDLKNDTTISITIKSYADLRGSEKYNIKLTERRSRSVYDYIIYKGIDSKRIKSESFGKTIIFNEENKNIEANYALNRRSNVVIIVSNKK